MSAAALLLALSLSHLDPASHAGLLLGQELPPPPPPPPSALPPPPPPPPAVPAPGSPGYSPASEREVTIKALREELTELEEQKGGIGFFFPIFWMAAGGGLIAAGTLLQVGSPWLNTALLVGGTAIAVLATVWLIFRIAKSINLGSQISDKEQQLRTLEAQRLQVGFGALPGGGGYGALTVRL
jgi:hypothetical protein